MTGKGIKTLPVESFRENGGDMFAVKVILLGSALSFVGTGVYLYVTLVHGQPSAALGLRLISAMTLASPKYWAGVLLVFALSFLILRRA